MTNEETGDGPYRTAPVQDQKPSYLTVRVMRVMLTPFLLVLSPVVGVLWILLCMPVSFANKVWTGKWLPCTDDDGYIFGGFTIVWRLWPKLPDN